MVGAMMKTLIAIFSLLLCCQLMQAHIYIAHDSDGRFLWLPSTKSRKLFQLSPHEKVDPIERKLEEDRLALQTLYHANNNDRHLK